MSDIKRGFEIWDEIRDIIKTSSESIKELSEKGFDKKILEKWIKVDDVLMNINGWLDANDYDELHQCVSDYINELKE